MFGQLEGVITLEQSEHYKYVRFESILVYPFPYFNNLSVDR
jgi:hypothetical protein